ncbi:VirD4-like conjugal transfer protein, CD1115 family, partial [Streptococcus pluranimalium]
VWIPDMTGYQAYVAQNAKQDADSLVPETSVHEQQPTNSSETTSESLSQTSEKENQIRTVDMATGEIFELPPEDQDDFGDITLDDQRLEV